MCVYLYMHVCTYGYQSSRMYEWLYVWRELGDDDIDDSKSHFNQINNQASKNTSAGCVCINKKEMNRAKDISPGYRLVYMYISYRKRDRTCPV